MKFCFHPLAGKEEILVEEKLYQHLYKARRTKIQELLSFRNLHDCYLYTYEHLQINKKNALLKLVQSQFLPIHSTKKLHLIWAITEAKNIEKTLPYLNQLGVKSLSLFFANRSQRNEKISLEKLQNILIASCEQCNRSDLMQIEILQSTQDALLKYPLASVLDFDGSNLYEKKIMDFKDGIFIGPQGGFDENEKILFKEQTKLSIPNSIILKSECAALLVSALTTI